MAKKTDPRYFNDPKGAALRRRLFRKIEQLESGIRFERDLIDLREKQLDEKRQRKTARLDLRLKKPLYQEELALCEASAAAQELLRERLSGITEKHRLAYRKLRQDLRRKEGLVDDKGRLKQGAKALSQASSKKLDELLAAQKKEKEALSGKLLEQARKSRLKPDELKKRKAVYDKAMQEKEHQVKALDEALRIQHDAAMKAFRARQNRLIESHREKLKALQASLLQSEQSAEHHLPEDVCLRLDNLSMVFGGLRAVDSLSFDVKKGEIFGLIGPNGAGKTTVFNCITQFYKPTEGNILYRTGEGNVLRLNNYVVHDIITKGIVRTFQNVEVIGELSILENLLIAAHRQYRSGLFSQMFNTPKVKREEQVLRERAMKVLDYCGLTPIKDLPPVGQPYGILKRIELARTLMAGANLIILDEPAAGLNDQETVELTGMIRRIQKDFKVTIFLVEHNMGLVMDLCDHICAISFGKKLAYGTPQEIQNNPIVQEAYLGTADAHELKEAIVGEVE